MPRVTVVIPAYNAAALIGPTLRSVLMGSCRDVEVVVIDDGSRDGTAATAAAHGSRIRVISQPNRGMSASRNRGIQESDSDFVALLDADDVWHPRKLELQLEVLEADRNWGLCYTEFSNWDGLAPPVFAPVVDGRLDEALSGWIYHRMIMTNFVLPSSVVFRRSTLDALGPFPCDNQQTDDWEYTVRASRTFPFAKLAAALVAYRQSAGSLSKRPSATNVTELMREKLIARYGLEGGRIRLPNDGWATATADASELARRRYKGWRDFADAHVARGDMGVGLRCFGRLLRDGPSRGDSVLSLARAAAARLASGWRSAS